jgi:hypothetical protein
MSKTRQPETEVTIIPPGKPSRGTSKSKSQALAVPASEDALMGEQLTTQYRRAVGGMQEVIIFGAMMIKLREKFPEITKKGPAAKSNSTRGVTPDEPAPITLKKWLGTYAPEVKESTAYRFLHVTESIANKYAEIVGSKTAKMISLPDLVTLPAEELPKGCEAKQLELFEFVNGTSQRSWLDMFSPESAQKRGHKTKIEQGNHKLKPKTAAELTADAEAEIAKILMLLSAWFTAGHQNRVTAETRETAEAMLEEARKKIKAVK